MFKLSRLVSGNMEKQNGTGKATIQLCSLPKRRRQRFFLICGTCNVVSIAENTPVEGKTGAKNSTVLKEEKSSAVLCEAQNNEDKCTQDHAEKSRVDMSDDPIKSSADQDLDKFPSLKKGMADNLSGRMGRSGRTKKKVCWSDRDDQSTVTDEVDGQSSDSLPGQQRSNVPQNNFEQNSPPSRKTSLKLHGASERKNSEETLRQCMNFTAKRVAWSADPSQSQAQLLDEKVPSSPLPLADNSTLPGKEPSNTTEINNNDAIVKPAWSENEAEVVSTAANRWKRLAPIKFRMNRIQSKRTERDIATVREEYEIMMENLKLYGVL